MIFAAHADDTSACMGGTAALLAQVPGVVIRSVICVPARRTTVSRETRCAEAEEEHRRLGLPPPEFLEFYNEELTADIFTRNRFKQMIAEQEPDLVFTHFPGDDHPDHRTVACLGIEAGLARGAKHETFCFPAWRSTTEPQSAGFVPTHVVDISQTAAAKYSAIDAHASQNAVYLGRLGESISGFYRGVDGRYGQLIRCSAAEPFCRLTRARKPLPEELGEMMRTTPFLRAVAEMMYPS